MKVNKPNRGRCWIFEHVAREIWSRILTAHRFNIDLSEIGLTKDIMVALLKFNAKNKIGLNVYVKAGTNENIYGSDMDLFVEVAPNAYVWFALQAKILKRNGRYTTLRDGHNIKNPTYQWEKLRILESLSGCKGYFLLYNAILNFKHNGYDYCKRMFNQSQFGCSLVELNEIETFALKKDPKTGNFTNPTFEDIHPDDAQPWKVLVCCPDLTNGMTKYSLNTIMKANRVMDYIAANEEIDIKDSNEISENEIIMASQEANWQPEFRVVVKMKDNH